MVKNKTKQKRKEKNFKIFFFLCKLAAIDFRFNCFCNLNAFVNL